MSNDYTKAIDILTDPNIDYKVIVVELAKLYPSTLVSVVTSMQPWLGNVRSLIRSGNKIDAIKLYRHETGSSLLDAKNAVEAMERNI